MWLRTSPSGAVRRISPATDLVIDGFWRCGNTYARTAFLEANPGLRVSSFVHHPYAIGQAVRLHRPVIVLIREPADAVRSFLHYSPGSGVAFALAEYVRYYSRVRGWYDRVVVVDFETVISDLGTAIGACNARFGTDFALFQRTTERDRRIFDAIDAGYAGSRDFVGQVARPVTARHDRPDPFDRLSRPARRALDQAQRLYAEMSQLAAMDARPGSEQFGGADPASTSATDPLDESTTR